MYLVTETSVHNGFVEPSQSATNKEAVTTSILETLKVHHGDSYGWALACCSWETSMAEDVLQEAYLRALDGRARFSGKSTEKTWFFAVIKRVSADIYRNQKRLSLFKMNVLSKEQISFDAANDSLEQEPQVASLQRQEDSELLRQALRKLSQKQREVLHLVFYAELTLDETAETLGMNLGSVRTHYHRGKTRLVQLLQKEQTPGMQND